MEARLIPASKTLDIWYNVMTTYLVVRSEVLKKPGLENIASTKAINARMQSKAVVTLLGESMLSYMFPRNMKPIPALIVIEYLKLSHSVSIIVILSDPLHFLLKHPITS